MVGSRGSTGSSLTTFATHKTFLFEYFISNFCLSLDCLQLCLDLILGHLINESNNKKAVNVGQSCVRPLIVWRIGKKLMEIVDYFIQNLPLTLSKQMAWLLSFYLFITGVIIFIILITRILSWCLV